MSKLQSNVLKKIIDLVLYSNLWIACCAVAMTWQTQLLLGKTPQITPLIGLIFSATLVIYALHRLVGMSKVQDFLEVERYHVIQTYRRHIFVYALLALVVGGICFFYLSFAVQMALLLPALFSLAYVLPFLGEKRSLRLRDIDLVKIFLVAGVWAYVTVLLPALELNQLQTPKVGWMLVERCIFIFAITLPFDIRDLRVDKHHKVSTLPAKIGINQTLYLSFLLLLIFAILAYFNYGKTVFIPLLLSAILTYGCIYFSPKAQHDYYFTGGIDGMMLAQFCLIFCFR